MNDDRMFAADVYIEDGTIRFFPLHLSHPLGKWGKILLYLEGFALLMLRTS